MQTVHPLRDPFRPVPSSGARGDRNSFSLALKRSPLAYAAFIVMSLIILGAVFAPLMSPYDKDKIDLTAQYLTPSLDHPFGTDDLGRDIFVRVMHGGRITLAVGLLAMLVALVIGVAVGGVSGYYAGWVDNVLMRLVDLMLAVPVFFVILFVASIASPRSSIVVVCLMIGFTQWMEVARLVRAVVITTREHEFVDAARSLGLPDRRILLRHLLPHTTAPVLVAVTLGLAQAIIIESGISFLGFGVQPPTPSWGAMLQNAQSYLSDCPWIAVFPGLMIFLTVVCCNILADFLGDALSQIRSATR
ncbi:MAG: ABC transporter permease [Candidatus Krumholzibacteria bacterium]|nr:ABC transporter permease [Candidatus Krumholzibacteria bacterium]MDH4336055.1 ABC transporter permease [Candidatus Krumholzibacteria bacterium]MDH5268369.1 ABC transporter permease [Candidatus Krumholzibacteria bacterium]